MEERMDYRILSNGTMMPALGFGAYKIGDHDQVAQVISQAIDMGYRLIDTASFYGSEEGIADAIKTSGVKRVDLFLQTKLWHTEAGYDSTMRAVEQSLKALNTNYIDLYLVHQPMGDYYGAWRAMEELVDQGVLMAIGTSNFYEDRLSDLWHHARIKPVVNQIECHPYNQRKDLVEWMRLHQVVAQAWSPFSRDKLPIWDNPIIRSISEKHGVNMRQVVLRWLLQRGIIALPKASNPDHMKANFDIWDFKLSRADMDAMALIDQRHFLENHHTAAGLERLLQK